MSYYVLDCRIFFTNQENAENAYHHVKALAEHSAAHDVHVGEATETSWGRLHECLVDDNDGETDECETMLMFTIGGGGSTDPEDADPWVQPTGAHDAYQLGDMVTFEGSTYVSTVNANVWAPNVYGWSLA